MDHPGDATNQNENDTWVEKSKISFFVLKTFKSFFVAHVVVVAVVVAVVTVMIVVVVVVVVVIVVVVVSLPYMFLSSECPYLPLLL